MTHPVAPGNEEFDFESYRNFLLWLARRLLPGWLQARLAPSDIVQDTYLAVRQLPEGWVEWDESRRRAWLQGVLANVVKRMIRDHCRQRRDARLEESLGTYVASVAEHLDRLFVDPGLPPELQVERDEELVRLINALPQLPEQQQKAFELRHFEGLTYAEIALQLKVSTGAVSGMLRAALCTLRAQLGQEGD